MDPTSLTEEPATVPASPGLLRRAFGLFLTAVTTLVLLMVLVLMTAQVVRDRTEWLAFIMYVPLWPAAIVTAGWDLLLLGRALPLRFLLFCIGVGIGIVSIGMMWAPARLPEGDSSQPSIKLLQWNIQWGGLAGPQSLEQVIGEIKSRAPQIVCLSEAPDERYFKHYWSVQNGTDWNYAAVRSRPTSSHWYRLAVLTRWPVRLVNEWPLQHGVAALFEVDVPDMPTRPLRLMMVDLESEPSVPRSPSLFTAAELIERFAVAGAPIDVVLGDFNTPGRFRGFDAISAAGERYKRAAMWSGQWRATWPARLVLQVRGTMREFRETWRLSTLDIDHIWVRSKLDVAAAELFTTNVVDHRGQTCTLRLPKTTPGPP